MTRSHLSQVARSSRILEGGEATGTRPIQSLGRRLLARSIRIIRASCRVRKGGGEYKCAGKSSPQGLGLYGKIHTARPFYVFLRPLENTMQSGWSQAPDLTTRLPVEILAIIFHYWKDSCPSHQHGLRADWVCATWVCKRWRDVALETAVLWSSVLISKGVTDDPVFEMQLDRAQGTALDLCIFNPEETSGDVEDALELVLAKASPVKKLDIVCYKFHPVVVEFIKAMAADVLSLSLDTHTWIDNRNRWQFTLDVFPRLRRLALSRIIPTPGAPLVNLTRLELTYALDEDAVPPRTGVHRFLAACPNLEVLRLTGCFAYEANDMIELGGKDVLPVVTLSKLRFLAVDQLGLDIATAVGTLRLPALSAFHFAADCANGYECCTFFIVPQNVTEALPPIRHSRSLSLTVGGGENDLSLRGSSGDTDTFGSAEPSGPREEDDGSLGHQWSIAVSGLDDTVCDDPEDLYSPCCVREFCRLFLARIPLLVVPSNLVRLQLHVSNGLPIAHDWARFFGGMPHLRALGIGSGALIRLVLEAFEAEADSGPGLNLCPELEDLELCVGVGLGAEDDGPGALAEFILRTLGAWVRGRAIPLRALTVHTPRRGTDNSDSDDSGLDSVSGSDSTSESDEECRDAAGSGRHTESSDLARKLCRDIGLTLKAFVCRVYLVGTDCPACSVEYKPHPEDWDATQFGELEEGVTYY